MRIHFLIRKFIARLECDPAFKVSVPAPWLALQLSLRALDDPVMTYEQCAIISYGSREGQFRSIPQPAGCGPPQSAGPQLAGPQVADLQLAIRDP